MWHDRAVAGFEDGERRWIDRLGNLRNTVRQEMIRRHGRSPIEWLRDIGFLGPDVILGHAIVVAGGVSAVGRLAGNALSFDLATKRWSIIPGPTPREHLGVTSLAGTVYAVGGRTSGLDTNVLHFESYRPGDKSWRRLQPVPDPRGGTGAAGLRGQIVSVGGEEPGGTIAEVLTYRVADRRWAQLDDLPTPRHGVGVAAHGGRVFVIGGGPEPGLTVSSANEALRVASG